MHLLARIWMQFLVVCVHFAPISCHFTNKHFAPFFLEFHICKCIYFHVCLWVCSVHHYAIITTKHYSVYAKNVLNMCHQLNLSNQIIDSNIDLDCLISRWLNSKKKLIWITNWAYISSSSNSRTNNLFKIDLHDLLSSWGKMRTNFFRND